MRTLEAIRMQLHLKNHKARVLPDHHPEHVILHDEINDLLTEREHVGRTLRPSQVRARTSPSR